MDRNPWIWERYGDLAAHAQGAWLQLIAGPNLMLHESVERKAEQMRAELAGPDPSLPERLLVERVVACWLQTQYADAAYAQLKGGTPGQHAAALRRQNSAQQRYLHAIRTLAAVRKLLTPAPSPLQLLRRPVDETACPPAALRARAGGAAAAGVGVTN
jgi:hypothetical protein